MFIAIICFPVDDVIDFKIVLRFFSLTSKGNQTMKFGQLIKYKVIKIFFKNQAENGAGRLLPDIVFLKNII